MSADFVSRFWLAGVSRSKPAERVSDAGEHPSSVLSVFGCLALAVGLFIPLALWVYSAQPATAGESTATAQQFVLPSVCRPEPGERRVFLSGLAYFPAALLGIGFAFRRLRRRGWFAVSPAWLRGLEFTAAGLLGCGAWWCLREQHFFHVARNRFLERPLMAWPVFLATALLLWRRLGEGRTAKRIVDGLAVALVVLVAGCCVFDEHAGYSQNWHFTAAFHSVVQVYEGKALLINCRSQYGLYAHFLEPLFAVAGLSVLKFTLTMATLLALSLGALWAVLRNATANRLAAGLGFFTLVFTGWLYHRFPRGGGLEGFDPYFQYHPIRFLFPTIMVWLGWQYHHRPRRGLYWATLVFLWAGVLWNLDSGLPALLAWLATLCFSDLFRAGARAKARVLAADLCAGGIAGAAVVSLYALVMYLTYGSFPHFAEFFYYQKLFYVAGFCMLPMELPGTWVVVVAVYLGGLSYATLALAGNVGAVKAKMVFLVSTLGLGLFSYYQGRSHPYVLILVFWPAFLLMTLLLDGLLTRLRAGSGRPLDWFVASLLLWCVTGFSWSTVREVPRALHVIGAQLALTREPPDAALAAEAARICCLASTGSGIVILSPAEAVLHLVAGVPPATPCSYIEMVLREDHERLLRYVDQHPEVRVYVDRDLFDRDWPRYGSRWLFDQLQERCELVDRSPSAYIFAPALTRPKHAAIVCDR